MFENVGMVRFEGSLLLLTLVSYRSQYLTLALHSSSGHLFSL
jgi:hypothetical protein